MLLLDTNICIYILKQKPPQFLRKFETLHIGDIALSSITVAELFFGALNSKKVEKNIEVVKNFLIPFNIFDFDENCAFEYAKIKSYLRKKGNIIGELDMQIAATALAHDAILVTNNEKEFRRVPTLKVENWI